VCIAEGCGLVEVKASNHLVSLVSECYRSSWSKDNGWSREALERRPVTRHIYGHIAFGVKAPRNGKRKPPSPKRILALEIGVKNETL